MKNQNTMEKRTYGPPTVTRVVPLLPELALLAGSDQPISGSVSPTSVGHQTGESFDSQSPSSTFNHEWN